MAVVSTVNPLAHLYQSALEIAEESRGTDFRKSRMMGSQTTLLRGLLGVPLSSHAYCTSSLSWQSLRLMDCLIRLPSGLNCTRAGSCHAGKASMGGAIASLLQSVHSEVRVSPYDVCVGIGLVR